MDEDYPYNDDLLITEQEQKRASESYGPVSHAFIFPELMGLVQEADLLANASKRRVRRNGFLSIGMVTLSLLVASAMPLLSHYGVDSIAIPIGAAVLGVLGALLGLANRHDDWLEHRLVTESLRQFHFRLIIELAPDILAAARLGDWTEFDRKRSGALASFRQDLIRRKPGALGALVDDPVPSHGGRIGNMPDPQIFETPDGRLLLSAYRQLRILRQRQYADHKLTAHGGLFSSFPRAQVTLLSNASLLIVALLFVMHVGSAFLMVPLHTNHQEGLSLLLHVAVVWLALLALALRAIEEGLRPRAEVERYRHYQAETRRILDGFDHADVSGKLQAAQALEHAAFDEMVIFLRSYEEARFVL